MIISGSHTNTNTAQGGSALFETKHYTLQKKKICIGGRLRT